eukprot:Gb_18582 [translate_table: standard]
MLSSIHILKIEFSSRIEGNHLAFEEDKGREGRKKWRRWWKNFAAKAEFYQAALEAMVEGDRDNFQGILPSISVSLQLLCSECNNILNSFHESFLQEQAVEGTLQIFREVASICSDLYIAEEKEEINRIGNEEGEFMVIPNLSLHFQERDLPMSILMNQASFSYKFEDLVEAWLESFLLKTSTISGFLRTLHWVCKYEMCFLDKLQLFMLCLTKCIRGVYPISKILLGCIGKRNSQRKKQAHAKTDKVCFAGKVGYLILEMLSSIHILKIEFSSRIEGIHLAFEEDKGREGRKKWRRWWKNFAAEAGFCQAVLEAMVEGDRDNFQGIIPSISVGL